MLREYWWLILVAILVNPLLLAAGFARWLRGHRDIDVKSGAACWEVFIKFVSAFTAIVSGAFLFAKYIEQQESAQRQELALRQTEFLRQKLQFDTTHHEAKKTLFAEAKSVAALLKDAGRSDEKLIKQFEELYWAKLIGVENEAVEGAMVRFRDKLYGYENAPVDSLDQLALQLSLACETELAESKQALLRQHEEIVKLAPRPAR